MAMQSMQSTPLPINEGPVSRQRAQPVAHGVRSTGGYLPFSLGVRPLPQREGLAQHGAAGGGERQAAAALVLLVDRDLHQVTPLQRFEIGGERGAVHGEQRGHAADACRFRAVSYTHLRAHETDSYLV